MGSITALHSTFLWLSPEKWWWIFIHKSWHLNDSMPWNLAAGSYIFWERGSSRRVIYPKIFVGTFFFFSLSISQHHWTSTCLQHCPGHYKVVQRNVRHTPMQQSQRLSGRVGLCTSQKSMRRAKPCFRDKGFNGNYTLHEGWSGLRNGDLEAKVWRMREESPLGHLWL